MLSTLKSVVFLRIELPLTGDDQGLLCSLKFPIGEDTMGSLLCSDCRNPSPGTGPKMSEPVDGRKCGVSSVGWTCRTSARRLACSSAGGSPMSQRTGHSVVVLVSHCGHSHQSLLKISSSGKLPWETASAGLMPAYSYISPLRRWNAVSNLDYTILHIHRVVLW